MYGGVEVARINQTVKIPFSLGIDSSGNYGYIKDGADTVTPFKNGDISFTQVAGGNNSDVVSYNIPDSSLYLIIHSGYCHSTWRGTTVITTTCSYKQIRSVNSFCSAWLLNVKPGTSVRASIQSAGGVGMYQGFIFRINIG